jgi:hypothetical protein
MASRLTTNQEIAGSTPAVVIWLFLFFLICLATHVQTRRKKSRRRVERNSFVVCSMRSTQIRSLSERFLSTVHRGTAFEYRALTLLTTYMSMSLTRVGGSYDGGIDLIGWWWVPDENPTSMTCACWSHASSELAPTPSFQIILSRPPPPRSPGPPGTTRRVGAGCASSPNAKPKRGRWVLRTCASSKVSSTDTPPPPPPPPHPAYPTRFSAFPTAKINVPPPTIQTRHIHTHIPPQLKP